MTLSWPKVCTAECALDCARVFDLPYVDKFLVLLRTMTGLELNEFAFAEQTTQSAAAVDFLNDVVDDQQRVVCAGLGDFTLAGVVGVNTFC